MLDAAILLAWFVGAVASACATCVLLIVVAQDREARIYAILWGLLFAALATGAVMQAGKMLEQLIRGIQ